MHVVDCCTELCTKIVDDMVDAKVVDSPVHEVYVSKRVQPKAGLYAGHFLAEGLRSFK